MTTRLILTLCLLLIPVAAFAGDSLPAQSIEIGTERASTWGPRQDVTSSTVLFNYYPSQAFHIGTSHNVVSGTKSLNGSSYAYRPDFHIGFLMPLIDTLFAEVNVGFDLLTGLLVAASLANDKNSSNIRLNNVNYSPYLNLGTALRWHVECIAFKLMAQTQYGGYTDASFTALNASAWIGLGATLRFAL